MLYFVMQIAFSALRCVGFRLTFARKATPTSRGKETPMNKSIGTIVSYRDWLRDEQEPDQPRQPFSAILERADAPKGAERIHLMRDSRRQLCLGRITG